MAQFKSILPDDVIAEFKKINDNAEQIFGDMTKAGAEAVMKNVKASVPLPQMASHVKLTRTYKTPTDGGINTKVYLSGYLPFSNPNRKGFSRRGRDGGRVYTSTKGVPVEFLANLYEYGRSTSPFPKKPFLRKSFRANEIEKAMLEAQKKASGGLLE
jgi:hypothetical protein